jgi:hypothetical protein
MTTTSLAGTQREASKLAAFEAKVKAGPDALQSYCEALCSRKANPIIRVFTSVIAWAVQQTCLDEEPTVALRGG